MTKIRTPFFRQAFLIVAIAAVSTILQLINFALLSSYLTVEDFGEYRIFLSIISFSGVFHAGYLDGLVIKWLINKKVPTISEFALFITLSVLSSMLLFFLPLTELNRGYMVTFTIVLNISAFISSMFFRANLFIIGPLITISGQLLLSLYLISYGNKSSVVNIVQFSLCVAILTSTVIFIIAFKKRLFCLSFQYKSLALNEIRKDLSIGIPILIVGFFFLSIFNIDKIILPFYFLDKGEFGYYSFSSSVITVIIGIFVSASSIVFKKLTDYESKEMIIDFYNKGFKIIFLVCIVQVFSLPILRWLIGYYLPKYILSFNAITGFSYFILPVLMLQLYTNNIYKAINKVSVFLFIAIIFTSILAVIYFTAHSFLPSIMYIPFFIAQLLIVFFGINEYLLCRLLPQLKKGVFSRLGMLGIYNLCLVFSFLNCKFIV